MPGKLLGNNATACLWESEFTTLGQETLSVASLATLHIANITVYHCLLHLCNHFDLKIWQKRKFV